jgi:predicted ATPase/signal transduction histidine kinase/DNA-binding response OmpR family regulator
MSRKYDQYNHRLPYSAFNNALSDLCAYLLTEPEQSLAYWRNLIQSALEEYGQVLIDFIPKLELIIGPQKEMSDLNAQELQRRFSLIFQNFMEAICTIEHPLVIFLDDLQWADIASLHLLQAIISNPNIKYCLIIGTYRDNEVDAAHPLSTVIETTRENQDVLELHLDRLCCDQIANLIADSLFLDVETCKPLADRVYLKTGGNPFFVIEYLKLLHHKGLLYFDIPRSGSRLDETIDQGLNKAQWQWRIDEIDDSNFMDNVVDLMVEKISSLDKLSQNLLRISACIGNTFDLEKLAIFYGKKIETIYPCLLALIDLNLIIPLSKNYQLKIPSGYNLLDPQYAPQARKIQFQFSHDRVQQAAYSLWSDREEKITHLKIGKSLYHRYGIPEVDHELFDLVSHLNHGLELIQESSTFLRQLAELNLIAGRRAKRSIAIGAALDYLETGLKCLPVNHWQENHEFSLAFYQELAEIQYLNGHHQQSRQTIEVLFNQAQCLGDKVSAFSLLKNLLVTLGQDYEEILETGLHLMRESGLDFSQDPDSIAQAIEVQLDSIQVQLANHNAIADLIYLPLLEAKPETLNQTLKMKLCMEFYEAAFYNGASDLILLTALNLVNLSFRYGNCKESSFGYVLYGMYLVDQRNFQAGYDFGNLALQVLDQLNDSVMLPKVRNLFCNYINYHLQPFTSNAHFYHENIQLSRFNGEIIFGVWATIFYIWSLLLSGQPLSKVYQESEKYWQFTQQTNDQKMIKVLQLLQLVILGFQGKISPPNQLQTESVDVKDLVQFWQDHNFINGLTWYAILHCQVLYAYGVYTEAIEVIETYAQELSPKIIMFPVSQYYVYYPLAILAAYPQVSKPKQQRFDRIIEESLQKLEEWQQYCPANFQSPYLLLCAELAQIRGDKTIAMDLYDQAIVTAQTYQNLSQQALANERAGLFWLTLNKSEFASIYLSKAYYQYQLWGAEGKVKNLTDQYPHLLVELTTHRAERSLKSVRESTGSESIQTRNIGLDLDSVLQVSQTLASEMNLEKLLAKIMGVVIENSGAELGYLLIQTDQNWSIKASGRLDAQAVVVDFPISLEQVQNEEMSPVLEAIPSTIVNYVARTQQPVLLDNAHLNHHFSNDQYLKKNQPKSVLCLPLVHQNKLLGLLYLENNLVQGVFTDDRLRTLQIITTQAAISLENAQLYNQITSYSKTLETKVKLRTEELEIAKEAADKANQSKSEFLSSMSHELRTPLNVILGFTQIMNRDSGLSAEQRENLDIINRSGEHLLTLINDILDLSKIDAGNMTIDQESFNLYSLLNTLEQMLNIKATNKNLDLIFDLSPYLPQYIRTDAKKLRQILINLLSNAIKFTHKGGVTLRASYNTDPDWNGLDVSSISQPPGVPQPVIKFEVEDTGIGIPSEDLERIFEPFVQTNATKTFIEGTGLGLAISRKFVDLMGGHIEISSQLNQGTTVKLTLPVLLSQAEEVQEVLPMRKCIKVDSEQEYRILIAEDRLESRNLLVKLLKPLGFHVEEVSNGQAAIEMWEAWSPHLILMDMRMPVMSGYDATQYIKRHLKGQATIIIALTASAFSDDKTVILSAGCDDFVGKPFREEVLLEKIAQHLGIRYIYEETLQTAAEPKDSPSVLTPQDLQVMPSEWIQALYTAANEADSEILEQLIQQIPAVHSNLVITLQHLIDNFGYDQIINLTQVEG